MKTDRTQKGQALILIVFAVIGLLALTGLAVDGSVTYSNRQGAQNAAETAALTGALDLANSVSNTTTIANDEKHAATASGFTDDSGVTTTVTVEPPGTFVAGCNGQTPSFANASQYVQVIINTNVNTSFSSIIGVKQTHNCVDAIAHGQAGMTGAMFNGAAIVATGCGSNGGLLLNSSATINTSGGGIFDNCGTSGALTVDASSKITGPSAVQVVGNATYNSCPQSTCVPEGVTTGVTPALSMPAAAWALIPAPPTAPTCNGAGGATFTPTSGGNINISGSGSTATASVNVNSASAAFTPGNFSSLNIGSSNSVTFAPGTYCLSNGLTVGSSSTATGASGTVSFVIGGSNMQVNSSGKMNNFNDLEIYSTNGGLTLDSSGSISANIFRFYSTGSGTFLDGSSGSLSANDAFFYLTSGYMTLNSSGSATLQAPTSGSYAGLLIYAPWSNSNSNGMIIDASGSLSAIGTILAPSQQITLNSSGSAKALQSQIIGKNFVVDASANLNVSFNAGQNYGTPTTATVELIK